MRRRQPPGSAHLLLSGTAAGKVLCGFRFMVPMAMNRSRAPVNSFACMRLRHFRHWMSERTATCMRFETALPRNRVCPHWVAILTCIQAHTDHCSHNCMKCFALSQRIPACGRLLAKAAMRLMRQGYEESSQHPRHGAYSQADAYAHLEGSDRVVQKVSIVMSGDVVTSLVGRARLRA